MNKPNQISSAPGEETFRPFFENHPIPTFVYNLNTLGMVYANPAMLGKYGCCLAEFTTLTLRDLLAPQEISRLCAELPESSEWLFRRKDGSLMPVLVSFSRLGLEGQELGLASVREQNEDASLALERARLHEQVRESEQRYRQFISQTAEIIFIFESGSLKVLDANPAFLDFLGYSLEEALGLTVYDIVAAEPADMQRTYAGVLAKGSDILGERTWRRKDGQLVSAHVTLSTAQQSGKGFYFVQAQDITQRKRVEEALRESEQVFHSLITQSADGIVLSDENGRIIEFNTAIQKMTGLSCQDVLGHYLWDFQFRLTDPARQTRERYENIKALTRLALQTGQAPFLYRTLEAGFKHPDGKPGFIQQRVFAIQTHNGWRLASISRDVTESKQAQAVLQASEQNFRNLAENTQDGILIAAADGRHIYANHNAASLLGYTMDELLQTSMKDLAEPGSLQQLRQRLEDRIAGLPVSPVCETNIRRKDGSSFPADVLSTRTIWQDQPCALVFFRDISERKRVEEELIKSEANLRAIIDISPVPMALNDDQQNITFVNPAFIQTFGYSLEDIPTLAAWWPRAYPDPNYRQWVISDWQKTLESARQTGSASPNLEVNIVCKNGTVKTVLVSAATFRDGLDGKHLVVLYDISDRKKTEDALQNAHAQLQAQMGELSKLDAMLREQSVHDPLTQLYNRLYLNETLAREVSQALQSRHLLGILMIDIDHFKEVNDTYGHDAGDEALQSIANFLLSHVRATDIVCRYGGEEIVCILPQSSKEVTLLRAEQLRSELANLQIIAAWPAARITTSIGVAVLPEHGSDANSLLKSADLAMYTAKNAGRNCVRLME